MSLKETIQGAREEAAANSIRSSQNKDAEKSTESGDTPSISQGFTRRSAARGKPAREAGAGVRVVTSTGKAKKKSKLTRAEQKEERDREREDEDRRYSVREMMLENDDEFKRVNKVWHRILIAGFVLIFAGLSFYGMVKQQGEEASTWLAGGALGTMLLAYVVMGIGLVYNWRMVRPLRIKYDHRVASMSDKKVRAAIDRGSVKK